MVSSRPSCDSVLSPSLQLTNAHGDVQPAVRGDRVTSACLFPTWNVIKGHKGIDKRLVVYPTSEDPDIRCSL